MPPWTRRSPPSCGWGSRPWSWRPRSWSRRARSWLRVGGLAAALPERMAALQRFVGHGTPVPEGDEAAVWEGAREMGWVPPGWALLKVPVTPRRIPALEARLATVESVRRYGAGGQVAWLATPAGAATLDGLLREEGLTGLLLWGEGGPLLGRSLDNPFAQRVQAALDPAGRFRR